MSPGRRVRPGAVIGISLGAIIVVAAGLALALWFSGRADSPEAGAQRYLEALASGDADQVRDTLTSDAAPNPPTLEAFHAASAYLTQPNVHSTETSGPDTATVSVTYFLGNGMREASFTVRQNDGRWLAEGDALGTLAATTSMGDAVSIGGVVLQTSASLVAFPAAYDVAAAPAGVLTGSASAVVAPGVTTEVAVLAEVASDADARVQPAVDDYLQACLSSSAETPATTSPQSCGVSIPWGADLASAHAFVFRIETLPTVALDPTGGFIASGGSYVVTVSGLTREGAPASFPYRDDAWTLRGAVSFEGSELLLQAW